MATDSNGEGRPTNPPKADWDRESKADWDREVQAMEVQDKLDTLIWVATPEEPRYTPPSEEERQASRAVGQVEADIPLMQELVKPGVGRSWTGMLFPGLFVLLLLFIAVLAFAMLRPDEQSAAPAVPAAPAAPEPAAGSDDPAVSGECSVSPTSLTVVSTVTLEDQGVNDPAMFVVQWDAGVTNNSTEPILVTAKIASSDNGGSDAWDASTYGRVAPGETYLWPTSRVTNNAGGAAGPTTWRYVDQILAVRDSPECEDLLLSPTDETAKAAIPAGIPPMPANAQLPDR